MSNQTAPAKPDQNTPIDDIDVLKNPVTRTAIDRYVLLSGFCKNKSVLSMSCGWGYGEMMLKALGAKKVIGYDIDEDAINHINTNLAPHVQAHKYNFVTDKQDPLEDEKFDTILSIETFEHVEQEEVPALLDALKRHATPESMIVITTPRRKIPVWTDNGGTHRYEYSPQEFDYIINEAFNEIWDIKYWALQEYQINGDYVTVRAKDLQNCHVMVAIMTPKNKGEQ